MAEGCMAEVIAIVNQGGGVGKSTTAWFLAENLAVRGNKVLLVDFDPLSDVQKRLEASGCVNDSCLLCGWVSDSNWPKGEVYTSANQKLDVLTWGCQIVELEISAINSQNREQLLGEKLKGVTESYDYVVVDTPSSIGLLTMNALAVAKEVIVPVRCDYFSLEKMPELMRAMTNVRKQLNPQMSIRGFLITHVNPNLRSAVVNVNYIRRCYGDEVLRTMICETSQMDELDWCYDKLIDEIF